MDRNQIIIATKEVLENGYDLTAIINLGDDSCAVFKRKMGWTYPECIYVSSFIENTFLFYADEFSYKFDYSGDVIKIDSLHDEQSTIITLFPEEDLTEEELEEIEAEIDRAEANDEMLFWDSICFDILCKLLNNQIFPGENETFSIV